MLCTSIWNFMSLPPIGAEIIQMIWTNIYRSNDCEWKNYWHPVVIVICGRGTIGACACVSYILLGNREWCHFPSNTVAKFSKLRQIYINIYKYKIKRLINKVVLLHLFRTIRMYESQHRSRSHFATPMMVLYRKRANDLVTKWPNSNTNFARNHSEVIARKGLTFLATF